MRATAVNTFRQQQQKVWRPPTLAQTHQGHNPHRTAHKQSKDKHNKSPPPRRRVDPDRPYTPARARDRPPILPDSTDKKTKLTLLRVSTRTQS